MIDTADGKAEKAREKDREETRAREKRERVRCLFFGKVHPADRRRMVPRPGTI